MPYKNVLFKNFKITKKTSYTKKILSKLLKERNQILNSLGKDYKDSYNKKNLSKYNKYKNIRIIGMGGSSLGSRAIYNFLRHKITKKLFFYDNLQPNKKKMTKNILT